MRPIWYFDFVSPFAYLQWQRIRGLTDHVTFALRPVLFAALLDRHGQKGPVEIPFQATVYLSIRLLAREATRPRAQLPARTSVQPISGATPVRGGGQ